MPDLGAPQNLALLPSLMANQYVPLFDGSLGSKYVATGWDGVYFHSICYPLDFSQITQPKDTGGATRSGQQVILNSLAVFGPGTYQWTGKMTYQPGTDAANQMWQGFQFHQGVANDGLIGFQHQNGVAFASVYSGGTNGVGGAGSSVSLGAQDWSSDTVFKIVWVSSASVAFYINGSLVATITTNVPSQPMMFFTEINQGSLPVSAPWLFNWVKGSSLQKL